MSKRAAHPPAAPRDTRAAIRAAARLAASVATANARTPQPAADHRLRVLPTFLRHTKVGA